MDNLNCSDLLRSKGESKLTDLVKADNSDSSLSSQVIDWISDHKWEVGLGVVAAAGAAALVMGRPQAAQAAERTIAASTGGARGLVPNLELKATEALAEKAAAGASPFLTPKAGVLAGDIAKVKADALITPINSEGMWWGALDGVIQKAGGNQFHRQASAMMPLKDGQTIVARQLASHKGAFENVVFVVDDLKRPLSDVIAAGLKAADIAGFKTVSMPAMRTGVMMGAVEKTAQATVDQMALGVKAFNAAGPKSISDIKFVVYNNEDIMAKLGKALLK